jgi:hypothetical protein
MEVLETYEVYFAVVTNDIASVVLGPAGADKGSNRLTVDDLDTWFVDHGSSGTFQAQDSYWYLEANSTGTIAQVTAQQTDITDRINGAAAIDNWDATDPGDENCPPGRPAGAPAAKVRSVPMTAQVGEESSRGVQLALPRSIELGRPFPNPSRGRVEVAMSVPPDRLGRYAFEVFDVTGRRVLRSDQTFTSPGRFTVVWSGWDESGLAASSGIYFLRLTAPGFREVRKVTLVR